MDIDFCFYPSRATLYNAIRTLHPLHPMTSVPLNVFVCFVLFAVNFVRPIGKTIATDRAKI